MLLISIPLFLSSDNFSWSILCLLTSDFFCLSYKFTMELFSLHCLYFSSFLFLSCRYWYFILCKILSLLENFNNLYPEWCRYREILFFSFYAVCNAQESSFTFHSLNVQSVSVTLWIAHSIHCHYLSCLPVRNYQFIFCPF